MVRAAAAGETCGVFNSQIQTACPSSCTDANYTYWYYVASGFQGGYVNPTPCTGASCVQPFTYGGAPPNYTAPL